MAGCGRHDDSASRRAKLRDQFESMRLLYVAATRAQDLLILSGAAKDLKSGRGSWLGWIGNALGLDAASVQSGVANIDERVPVRVMSESPRRSYRAGANSMLGKDEPEMSDLPKPRARAFPLLRPLEPERHNAIHRFSVTQLINYRRCPRQYYFDRVLHAPSGEEIAVWNDAEAPEPPANLNATLERRGDPSLLREVFRGRSAGVSARQPDDVLRLREAELGDRVAELDLRAGGYGPGTSGCEVSCRATCGSESNLREWQRRAGKAWGCSASCGFDCADRSES